MSESLRRILREEIACHDAMPSTTQHLSRIRHAEAALLALLEEKERPDPGPTALTKVILFSKGDRVLIRHLALRGRLAGRDETGRRDWIVETDAGHHLADESELDLA